MNPYRFIQNATRDKSRDSFFEVLIRAVIIKRPEDDNRLLVGGPIRINQSIGAGFRRSIGTHGQQWMIFIHLFFERRSIDFRSRDVNKSLHPVLVFEYGIGHGLGSQDIRFEKDVVIINGTGHMGLRSEMDHDVGLGNKGINQFSISHVSVPEDEPFSFVVVDIHRQILNASGIGEGVENDDLVIKIFMVEVPDKITSHKPCPPGD
jgi:hypothetical protein